jgi:hypothetical protein
MCLAQNRSTSFPILLKVRGRQAKACALLDSGAMEFFLSPAIIRELGLVPKKLERARCLRNVDNKLNGGRAMEQYTTEAKRIGNTFLSQIEASTKLYLYWGIHSSKTRKNQPSNQITSHCLMDTAPRMGLEGTTGRTRRRSMATTDLRKQPPKENHGDSTTGRNGSRHFEDLARTRLRGIPGSASLHHTLHLPKSCYPGS